MALDVHIEVGRVRQGERNSSPDMNDHHFLVALYGNKGKHDEVMERLSQKARNDGYGVGVREVKMYEVVTHPKNVEKLRKYLSHLHSPSYFKSAFGNAIRKIKTLALSIAPINSFKKADEKIKWKKNNCYGYVIGEHNEESDREPRDADNGEKSLIDHLEVLT